MVFQRWYGKNWVGERKRERGGGKKERDWKQVNEEIDVFYLCKLARGRMVTGHSSKKEKGVCILK